MPRTGRWSPLSGRACPVRDDVHIDNKRVGCMRRPRGSCSDQNTCGYRLRAPRLSAAKVASSHGCLPRAGADSLSRPLSRSSINRVGEWDVSTHVVIAALVGPKCFIGLG